MALYGGVGSAAPSTIPAAIGCREESSVVLEAERRLGVVVTRSNPRVTTRVIIRRTTKIGEIVIIVSFQLFCF